MSFPTNLVLQFFILISANLQVSMTDEYHTGLLTTLFNGSRYDTRVRPVRDPKTVTELELQFFIAHVLDMDERKQTLTSSTWLTMIWMDEFLTWEPSEYGNITKIVVPAKNIWLPDIYFYESATQSHRHFMETELAKIHYNGKIMWGAPVIFKGYCLVRVKYFPFDNQECQMKFGPWQHSGHELIINGTGYADVFVSNGEWDMYDLSAKNNVEYYPDDPGVPFTDVTFTIYFQRRSLYYVFHLITPCFLIAIMASLAFLLPPESQGKVNMGVTFLLSMTVFLMVVADAVPHTNEVPIIGQYFAITMILVSLSLLMNVTVASLYYRGNEGRYLPTWAKMMIHRRILAILRIPTKHLQLSEDDSSPGYGKYYMMQGRKHKERNGYMKKTKDKFNEMHMTPLVTPPSYEGVLQGETVVHASKSSDEVRLMSSMLKELGIIKDLLKNKAGEERTTTQSNHKRIKNEWLLLSRVLDRFFFFVYVVGNLLALFLLLIGIYN
ncbi:neuronal acetylcholine receptor subunit alpha-10-like isoform X2 [Anneissia japonica]|uniref:neuronal acetylcholine receptor subunit alpha-10-like isoform X2 n=1 Tax=Anneissia japonica TaxID=1529436 RepID=UPI0014255795|nr:neuronal acetylcholine receptor subunit alpha-10-like isoform X2 [Anneissia japonica]